MMHKLNPVTALRESDASKLLADLQRQFLSKPSHFLRSSIAALKKRAVKQQARPASNARRPGQRM